MAIRSWKRLCCSSQPIDITKLGNIIASDEISKIDSVFSKYQEKAYDSGILYESSTAQAVGYAIDNNYDESWLKALWEKSMIFPCPAS